MKNAFVIAFSLILIGNPFVSGNQALASNGQTNEFFFHASVLDCQTGGGADDEKKKKHARALKKARKSAKEARYASQMSRKQVMMLARVRNFFHDSFNTKPGRYRNFRSPKVQQRWLKSKS